jgi:hypothetical protein
MTDLSHDCMRNTQPSLSFHIKFNVQNLGPNDPEILIMNIRDGN